MIGRPRWDIFEKPVDSIDQFDEEEFEVLIRILESECTELEEYVEEPKQWFIDLCKRLQIGEIYTANTNDLAWSQLNWIGDPKSQSYWFYIGYGDGFFLYEKIETNNKALTKEAIWPHLLKHLELYDDIYCDFSVNSRWVEKIKIGDFFRGYLKGQGTDRFDDGKGLTVDEWLAEEFSEDQ